MRIRKIELTDAFQIAEIYNYYIETSHATFELETINSDEMENRIRESLTQKFPFFACEKNGEIVGYTYGRQFRPRRAYLHSIEVSVYIKNGCEGKGIGTKLYEELFREIWRKDFHAIIAGISLPNETSVKLHEKFGFKKVAHFREVGRKFDRWIDVGYWELLRQNKK
jgi:L-amino acid N-acyltransferase YncA